MPKSAEHSFAVLVTLSSEPDMLGVAREQMTPDVVASACARALGERVRVLVGPMVPVEVAVSVVDRELATSSPAVVVVP